MSVSRYTSNYGLRIIDYNSQNWHDDDHANLDIIDGALGSVLAVGLPFGLATNTTPGAGNNFAVTLAGITAYTVGMRISFFVVDSTVGFGNFTINVNGLGSRNVLATGNISLSGGILSQNDYVEVVLASAGFELVKPLRVVSTLLVKNGDAGTFMNANAGASTLVVESNDNTGISILSPSGKINRINFGTNDFGGTFQTSIYQDPVTGNLTFGIKTGYFDAGVFTNTVEFKTDRVISKLAFDLKDTSLGTNFSITNNANDQFTIAFLGGTANGLLFKRTGAVECQGLLKLKRYTVATLPAAAASVDCIAIVSDATATTQNSIVAGGGTNIIMVYSNGTNWRIC